ncbi:hypothetical protein NAC44_20885 [Allorhizobium sp. BGMRC 0089]|uniref:hypothetical protein n=1 Tax=Allorhizobium sonneratiae TaxID=2934936 RepID=UPI002033BDCD|nr:hypothetical protein [Allorhizobium sonneratiae]MCM2294786.1 hypothetical protein [Allorhizobium sonneratiae]
MTSNSRSVPRLALSRDELAASIGVSPTSIDVMVSEGVLPKPKIWHTRKIWPTAEIEMALANMKSEGESRIGYFDDIGQ